MTTQIVEYSKTEAALADLAGRYKAVVFDVSTPKGMAEAIKGRAELRGYRLALEKTRVELKAPALERSRLIDAEAKRITAELVALEDPIDAAIKSEESRKERERAEREAAEQRRKADILAAIAEIANGPAGFVGRPAADVAAELSRVTDMPVTAEAYMEFVVQAAEAKGRAIAALEQLHAGAVAIEQQRADMARQKAEQDERDRKQREAAEESARVEAAAKKKRDDEEAASKARIAAEEKAAREAREAADKKAADERKAEQARLDAIAKAQREAQEQIDTERRETERLQNELLDGASMLRKFVERFGKRREFGRVVKAINEYEESRAEAKA